MANLPSFDWNAVINRVPSPEIAPFRLSDKPWEVGSRTIMGVGKTPEGQVVQLVAVMGQSQRHILVHNTEKCMLRSYALSQRAAYALAYEMCERQMVLD